jgi:hypothetical protein
MGLGTVIDPDCPWVLRRSCTWIEKYPDLIDVDKKSFPGAGSIILNQKNPEN